MDLSLRSNTKSEGLGLPDGAGRGGNEGECVVGSWRRDFGLVEVAGEGFEMGDFEQYLLTYRYGNSQGDGK